MAVETIEIKNLPVIPKPVDINNEDRLAISHRYTETWQGTTTINMNTFVNSVLSSIVKLYGNRRYFGEDVPSELLGGYSDLYFRLSDNTITEIYIKHHDAWYKIQGG